MGRDPSHIRASASFHFGASWDIYIAPNPFTTAKALEMVFVSCDFLQSLVDSQSTTTTLENIEVEMALLYM